MKIIRILSNSIFIVFIIILCYFALNYEAYFVATGSMQPTLKVNELILIKKKSINEKYQLGDIITFYDTNIESCVTHRIVEINGDMIYTKGDYNNTRDLSPVVYNNVIGKVIWNSYFLGELLLRYKYILVILLLLAIFALNLLLDNTTNRLKKGGI